MLRLVILLATFAASIGPAVAEAPPEAVPLEFQWLKAAGQIIGTVGMPGVIGGLLYLLKMQKDDRAKEIAELKEDREKEVSELKTRLQEERDYNRKTQEDRIASQVASADRLATVAVSSSNAIATAAEKNAGLAATCQTIKDLVAPLQGEHVRIIGNQEALMSKLGDVLTKVGSGCRA